MEKKVKTKDVLTAARENWPLALSIYALVMTGRMPGNENIRMTGAPEDEEQRKLSAAIMALTGTYAVTTGETKINMDIEELADIAQVFITAMDRMEEGKGE